MYMHEHQDFMKWKSLAFTKLINGNWSWSKSKVNLHSILFFNRNRLQEIEKINIVHYEFN